MPYLKIHLHYVLKVCYIIRQGLGLLINMVEHCDANRRAVLKSKIGKPFEMYNPLNSLVDTLDALTMVSYFPQTVL